MTVAIPLYILLILYIIFLLGWAFFSFFAIYHLLRFGFQSTGTFFMVFVFIGVSVIILFMSWQAVSQVDWFSQISILELGGSTPYF